MYDQIQNLGRVDLNFHHSFLILGINSIYGSFTLSNDELLFNQIISMVCKTIQLLACLHKLIDYSSSKLVVSQSVIMLGKVILVTLKVSLVKLVFLLDFLNSSEILRLL